MIMADVLDTTVTKSAEPEATPAAETTPTGQEPEGNQSKPESKFLQRLGKLLGIGGDGEDDGDGAAKSKEDGKADPPPKDGQTYTEADLQARIDAAKSQWQAEQEEQARLAKLSPRSAPRQRLLRPATGSLSWRHSCSRTTSRIRRSPA